MAVDRKVRYSAPSFDDLAITTHRFMGNQIGQILKRKGLSIHGTAKRFGITYSHLHGYIHGRCLMNGAWVRKILRYLGYKASLKFDIGLEPIRRK